MYCTYVYSLPYIEHNPHRAYANWSSTSTGTNNNEGDEDDNDNDEDEKEAWRVYVHGNTYKIPSIVDSKLFQLVENFLADALANLDGLSAEELAQAKNMTAEVYVVQQKDVEVTIDFAVDDVGGGGGVVPDGDGKADGVVAAVCLFPFFLCFYCFIVLFFSHP